MVTAARPLRWRLLRCSWRVCAQVRQVVLELGDAAHDAAAVDLELGLARATVRVPMPPLCCDRLPLRAAPEAGQAVAQQRQLDLGLALERVGVLGEDVEDDRGAVDGRAAEQLLQVELLGRAELVVEHHGVGVDLEAQLPQLLDLALADEPRGVGRVAPLHEAGHLVGAGGVDQERQLVEAGLGVVVGVAAAT